MQRVQTAAPMPVFLKRTPGRPPKDSYISGFWPVTAIVESHNGLTIFIKGVRVTPGGVFAFFFRRGKKEVAAHSIAFSVGSRFLCADILKTCFSAHAIKHRLCFGTPFLGDKNGGKEPSGGFPP